MEALFQKNDVALASTFLVELVDAPTGPGVDRGVEIRKLPFVGRNLSVRVLKLLEQQHPEIFLGEFRIDQGERDALEGQIPGGKPGKLPLVRHGQDAHGIQVAPVDVPTAFAGLRGRRVWVIALEPAGDVE